MILIDNYDSFTYNIVQYLRELGANPWIFKNDEITIDELKQMDFSSIIISPGPKNPSQSGISMDVIKEFYTSKKILGICLGHQCIAQYFGCKIIKSKKSTGGPTHGKVSKIYFEENELFKGLSQGFEATRYHSLIVDSDSLTDKIIPLAYARRCEESNDEAIQNASQVQFVGLESPTYSCEKSISRLTPHSSFLMALKHKDYPIYGVQFHPEAILTEGGKILLSNFMCLS